MRRLLLLVAGFGYLVLLIESLRVAVAWWQGELAAPGPLDLALLVLLPVLALIWWRFFSPFAPGRGQCLLPEATTASGSTADPPAASGQDCRH